MKKWMKQALLLLLVLCCASGCSLIYKDPEVDKQTVVLEVNGRQFLKGEVREQIDAELDYQVQLYAYQYGQMLDPNDPEVVSFVEDSVLEILVEEAVVDEKLAAAGFDVPTDEERATAQANADERYASYLEEILTFDLTDPDLPEEEKLSAAEGMMAELGYPTKEAILEAELQTIADNKLIEQVTGNVTLTEEELQQAFQERVEMAQADYEYDPSYYDMDVSDGATIYYRPEGYRYVKQILIPLSDEDRQALADLNADVENCIEELSALQERFAEAETDEGLLEEHEAAEAALSAAEAAVAAKEEEACAALQPQVDAVLAALDAGEDFDTLASTYGSDTDMAAQTGEGYLIGASSENYVEPFREAAMALEQVGDVSEPVCSEYGIHIIRYAADAPSGAVELESVREVLTGEVLQEKKNEVFRTQVESWVKEADVKVYKNRLAD